MYRPDRQMCAKKQSAGSDGRTEVSGTFLTVRTVCVRRSLQTSYRQSFVGTTKDQKLVATLHSHVYWTEGRGN